MTDRSQVTNKVRAFRKEAGLKQRELAALAKVSLRTVTFLENDPNHMPLVGVALRLARLFECSVEDLFFLNEKEGDEPGFPEFVYRVYAAAHGCSPDAVSDHDPGLAELAELLLNLKES